MLDRKCNGKYSPNGLVDGLGRMVKPRRGRAFLPIYGRRMKALVAKKLVIFLFYFLR
jgi:hypothetical protein